MATPLSLEAQQLLKQMAGGQWRHREDVVNILAPAVAPGRALRRFEADAIRPGERLGPEPSDEEKIRMGQRRIAQVVVRSLKRRYLESEIRGDGEWLRARPEPLPLAKSKVFRVPDAEPEDELRQCDRCGGFVLTSQQEDHDEFHAVNDAGDAVQVPKGVGGESGNPPAGQAGAAAPELASQLLLQTLLHEELTAAIESDGLRRLIAQEVGLAIGGRMLRQLVRDEVGSLLETGFDDFQAGMQRFLSGWMDDLEKALFTSRVTKVKLLGGTNRT